MTKLDDILVPAALKLITDLGKNVTVTAHAVAEFDLDEGVPIRSADIEYTVKASPPAPFSRKLAEGEAHKEGATQIFLAASGLQFTPDTGQKVDIDGESFTVVAVTRLYSGASIAAYRLTLAG